MHASGPAQAWLAFSSAHLVRSVLVMPAGVVQAGAPARRSFDFERAHCTVRELWDAFAAAYGLTWTRDSRTGIVWLHPAEQAYEKILAPTVRVPPEQLGLPMFSGILEPLAASGALRPARSGSLLRNTFDYAVDVRAGTYQLRDLVNLCCEANPTKSFLIEPGDGDVLLTPVNLAANEPGPVRAGAALLWDTEIRRPRGGGIASDDRLRSALADEIPGVRRAARAYLEANLASVQLDELALGGSAPELALWTCVGIASVIVRSDDATHRASIETLRRFATEAFLARCEPGLALMTGLDLTRLAGETQALEIAARRAGAPDASASGAFAAVASDACRVAALSAFVREQLQERAAAVLDAIPALAALVRSRAPGKLELSLPD